MSVQFDFLWKYLDYWASVDSGFPALKFHGEVVSYGLLKDRVDRVAGSLVVHGVGKGDRVATVLPMRPEYIYMYLACARIGAICVPMDVRYRISEFRRFLGHVKPKVVVALDSYGDNNIRGTLEEIRDEIGRPLIYYLNSEPSFHELLDGEPLGEPVPQTPDDSILIIFTGGTTGVPKATLLSHRNIVSMAVGELNGIINYIGREERMTFLVHLPPSHVGGTTELFTTGLVNGAKMVLVDHWRPDVIVQLLREEKIAFFGAVPTMYALIFSLPIQPPPMELCVTAGERLNPELLKRMQEWCGKIAVGYGSTETAGFATFSRPWDDPLKFAEGYVGVPLEGVDVKIVDDSGKELPDGEVGEVLVVGPVVSKGYFNQPEETGKGFHNGYWVSGDLGYKRGSELYIEGRKKEVIRVGSYTVLPTEVEEVVMRNPKVAMAAAIGVPHEIYGEVVWLVVVPKQGESISKEELIEACRRELADYKVPRRVLVRDSMPMTRLGKTDRIRLKEAILRELSGSK
ncbi:MAG: acyl--CoA ligase [Desulfurococcales archaeon]|nr:acyl--CoA ligase [Desulfurococcales archaeon]